MSGIEPPSISPRRPERWQDIQALLDAAYDIDDDTFKGVAKDAWNALLEYDRGCY